MLPRSLPVDPVSYPITTAVRGRREGGDAAGHGGGSCTENKGRDSRLFLCLFEHFREMLHVRVPRETPTPVITHLEGEGCGKTLLSETWREMCVRKVNGSVCDKFAEV